jgi:outer membrane protein assembly factor BamB/orotate phosphoribosyltransferase
MNAIADGASLLAATAALPPRSASIEAERELLRRAILEQVVLLKGRPTFDFKEILTQTGIVQAAGRALWIRIRHLHPDVLVAPGFGGAPLLYATAFAAMTCDGRDLPVWMVRDQRKTYYRKRWVEGPRLAGRVRAVMLDDFLGRGTAVQLIDEALAADGLDAELCGIAVLYDDWMPLGSRQLSVSRCPVTSVFKRHDIGLTRDCHDARPPLMQGEAPALIGSPLWWRFDFNGASDRPFKSSPVVADEAVFAADDRARLWRFDALTGEAQWCVQGLMCHDKGVVQRLQHVDSSIVFGSYDGTVTRVDAATGALCWRWRVDTFVHATPVVDLANGRVFVNSESMDASGACGHLSALDWHTGRVQWRRRWNFYPPATPCHDPATDSLVATCNDGSLDCVDARTGELRWHAQTEGLVRGRPAIERGAVFVATEEGWLQSFDLHSGEQIERRRYGGGSLHQFTLARDGLVYTLDKTGHLAAFDCAELKLRWINRLRSEGAWAPVPCGGFLIVLSVEGHLAVVDALSGLKHWEGAIGGHYRQAPAVGTAGGAPLLVCASHRSGLKAFRIHPHYCDVSPS